jgi:hypothetical protein
MQILRDIAFSGTGFTFDENCCVFEFRIPLDLAECNEMRGTSPGEVRLSE